MLEGVTMCCQLVLRISRGLTEVVENVDSPKWMLEAWHAFFFFSDF